MLGWLGDAYLWVKAAHVVFVIFWVAGLLIVPRFLHLAGDPAAEFVARDVRARELRGCGVSS